jgi:hypothetical protein
VLVVVGSWIWVALMSINLRAWKTDNPGAAIPLAMLHIQTLKMHGLIEADPEVEVTTKSQPPFKLLSSAKPTLAT